jgi:hypothetical protein
MHRAILAGHEPTSGLSTMAGDPGLQRTRREGCYNGFCQTRESHDDVRQQQRSPLPGRRQDPDTSDPQPPALRAAGGGRVPATSLGCTVLTIGDKVRLALILVPFSVVASMRRPPFEQVHGPRLSTLVRTCSRICHGRKRYQRASHSSFKINQLTCGASISSHYARLRARYAVARSSTSDSKWRQ